MIFFQAKKSDYCIYDIVPDVAIFHVICSNHKNVFVWLGVIEQLDPGGVQHTGRGHAEAGAGHAGRTHQHAQRKTSCLYTV